jgi:general secretion pathway protein F
MAGFKYHAIDTDGRVSQGVLEEDSPRQARQTLRERGLIPLDVALVDIRVAGSSGVGRPRGRVSALQLALLTRQLSTLASAGLTVEESMDTLIEQTDHAYMRQVLAGARGEVLAGQTLAKAFAAFPNVFPDLYITLVGAGERSGQLGRVLEKLADYTEQRQALRQQVGLAFIYPAILSVVAITIVTFLLAYVVPQVVDVFRHAQQTLPLLTRFLIVVSDFVRTTLVFWVIAIVAGIWAARIALKNPALRLRFHAMLLRLPIVGRLIRDVNAARLANTLAILTGSGVPLLTALAAGSGVLTSMPLKRALEDAERMVREGARLSRAIAASGLFPPLLTHLIASGEASGKLDAMLERAAMHQARELSRQVSTLTALLEPALILLMGGMVLIIVLGTLMPIFEMNQLIH